MASFGNKRYTRLWPLLGLIGLASFLLWRNLQQARTLSLSVVSSEQLIRVLQQNTTTLTSTTISLAYEEEPREIYASSRTRALQQLLKCRNRNLIFQRLQHGEYWLLQNLVVGQKSRYMGCAESITYTTNGDYTFFTELETVAQRWNAPISFAIHTPGYDLNATLDAIQYVKNCLPGSQFINDYVTFHLYFPNTHMPKYVPYGEQDVLNWPYNCWQENGTMAEPPYTQIPHQNMYKVKANLTYPINVGRNIARQAANTHFIFACDIELYPSLGFVDQFLDLVARNHSVLALDPQQPRRVYPLPVFEIEKGERIPSNKTELMYMYIQKRARIFHTKVCVFCHKVPSQQEWLSSLPSESDELELFSMTLRQGKFKYWEPFYVSDNTEPLFDERVTWEGQSNKRIQNYAMCLLGYEYHVLNPAFLVHHPGYKKLTKSDLPRLKFARAMTKFIKTKIEPEYRVLFGKNANCTT